MVIRNHFIISIEHVSLLIYTQVTEAIQLAWKTNVVFLRNLAVFYAIKETEDKHRMIYHLLRVLPSNLSKNHCFSLSLNPSNNVGLMSRLCGAVC